MNKIKLILLGMVVTLLITGCTYKESMLVSTVDISKTNMSNLDNLKVGRACITSVLLVPVSLNATAKQAAKNGGISKIKYQEYTHSHYPFYSSDCIVVYGE